jgi:N-acetylmuramic acid 6-phosphate etherase
MTFIKTTEQDSKYNHLEKMSVSDLLKNINNEDKTVPLAVEKSLPQIIALTDQIVNKLQNDGRLFYIGAGTGDIAIRKAVEFAEDSTNQGWLDLQENNITDKDVVVGIAASGTTPYVISALEKCNTNNIITGCITCNKNSPLSNASKFPVEVIVGPEFVTGSSRMKAGTAQKLVLNMLSTATMIQLGKIKGNKMVDMQLSNNKLVERGQKMLAQELSIDDSEANTLLMKFGNVRNAIKNYKK